MKIKNLIAIFLSIAVVSVISGVIIIDINIYDWAKLIGGLLLILYAIAFVFGMLFLISVRCGRINKNDKIKWNDKIYLKFDSESEVK